MTELSSIKIPAKVYVGFQGRRSQDEVPLGFMTPYAEDKAGQKRRDTVDNWAKGYYGSEKTFNSVMLENKPMIGFKVGRSIRRSGGWNGSGASYVRVEDPRGFELEITIENLVMCMSDNHIQDGEIVAECVWGREGNRNILLPTNSEPYKASVATTEKISKKLSLRDIKPGDTIKFLTGETAQYFGSLFPLYVDNYHYGRSEPRKLLCGAKRYVVKIGNEFKAFSSIMFDEIVTVSEKKLEPVEIERVVNKQNVDDTTNSGWGRRYCGWVTSEKYEFVSLTREVRTEDEIKKLGNDSRLHIFGENTTGQVLVLDRRENFEKSRKTPGRYYEIYDRSTSYYSYNRQTIKTDGFIGKSAHIGDDNFIAIDGDKHIEEADLKELFLLKVEVKSKLGETYSVIL